MLAILLARIVYLFCFNAWELVADEAHYWEWSRRLDWSYYTKGPGVAWMIWLSTQAFGNTAAAVRLPAAIASACMMLAGARLAFEISGGNGRAAINAVIALGLAPAYFVTAQLLTTDVFWAAGWVISTWLVFRATRREAKPSARWFAWTATGFIVGLTCLFKYTALFFVPGAILFLIVQRRELRIDRSLLFSLLSAMCALLIAASPILIWNITRGWPTVSHQVGRVRLPGGDEGVDWNWSPLWFFEFVGAQLALLGVVGAILIVAAIFRERRSHDRPMTRRLGTSLLISVSIPLLVFYMLLSLVRQVEGNWAIACYSTLLVFVGVVITDVMESHRTRVRQWLLLPKPRPRAGFLTRRPETPMQVMWHWLIGVGIVVAIVVALGPRLLEVPALARIDTLRQVNARVTGAHTRAAELAAIADAHRDEEDRLPMFIASRYQDASLLAFYLPGQPTVFSAASRLGSRRSAYDFFADTDLADPQLKGRTALLIGGDLHGWRRAFEYHSITPLDGPQRVFLLERYGGPKTSPSR